MISLVRNGGRRPPLNAMILAIGIWVLSGSAAMAFGDDHGFLGTRHWGEYGLGPHLHYRGHGLDDFGYPYFTHWIGHGVPYQAPGYPYGSSSAFESGYPVYLDFGAFTGAPANPERFATAVHSAATTGSATRNGVHDGDLTAPNPASRAPVTNH